jgi:4-hydroxybenzoate polyprenyltransferase
MALAYALTVYYARGGDMAGYVAETVLSTAALALVIAGGYVLNDVVDAEIDRRGAPHRAIAAGRVTRRAGAVWAASLLAAGLLVSALCRWEFPAALAVVAVELVAYDLLSKRLGVFKQLLVAALMASIYPLAIAASGGVAGSRARSLAFFPAWLFLTAFAYETLKDLRDRRDDPAIAGRPTPIQRRPRLWLAFSRAATLLAVPILVGPYLAGCGWVYAAGAGVAAALAVASTFVPLRAAILCIYAECVLVGLAAAADVMILGV